MADRTIPAFKILRGSVGVGTTLPSSTFHVYSDSSTNTIINLQGGSATNKGAYMNFFRGTTNVGALGTKASLIGGTSNDMMFYSASNDWIFYSTGERMRVQADGLVGIGTNAPSSLLHVYGSSSYLLDVHQTAINWAARIKNTSGGGYGLSIDTSASTANNVATLACYTPSGTGVFVTNQGRLAIGLTAPTAALHVSSSASVVSYLIRPSASPTVHIGSSTSAGAQLGYVHANDYAFYGHDAAYNAIVVKSSGSVGIGTTNPNGFFQVGTVTDSSTTASSLVHLLSATASSTVNGFSTLKLDYKSGHAPSTAGAQIMFNQGYHSGNQDYTAPVGSIRGWKTGPSDNYGGGLQFLYQPDSGALGLLAGMTLEGSGNVGIGTNAPGQLLEVGSDGNTDYALIGPTKVGGGMGHGNYAGFSHRDMGGTGNYALIQSSSGHTYLNSASGQNLSFRINNSDTMYMSSAALNFNDSKKVILGNDSDLQLFHDGSNSYIQNGTNGSLNVTLNAGGEFAARFVKDGAVELYHNGSKRIETDASGVKIAGPSSTATYVTLDTSTCGYNAGIVFNECGNNRYSFTTIASDDSFGLFKYTSTAGYVLRVYTNGVVSFPAGFVGIGTASTISSSNELLGLYSAGAGHACFKSSSDSTGTVYVRNVSTTANTWQPYLILADSGGNRGGLALKYSTAGLKVHGQGGIEFWTGSSFGGGTVKMTIASGGTVSVGGNFTIPQGNLLYLDGGSNTYIYSDTADSISYVTNSGIRLITNNSGLTIPSNNNLSLGNGANNAGKFRFYNNNSTAYYIDWKSTGARSYEFEGSSSGSDYVTSFSNADSSGGHNLNIEGMLRVKNKAGNTNRFTVSDSGVVTWGSNADSGHGQMSWDTGKAYIYGTSGNALAMGANGNGNIMHIKTNYEVHIGAGNGLQGVAIHGNTSGYGSIVGVSRDGSSYKNLEINGATVEFKAAGTVKMTVGSGGVGIGMSPSNTYRLAVTGSTNTPVQLLSTADNLNLTLGNSTQTQFSNILFNSNSGNAQIWKAGGSYTAYGGPNSLNLYSSNGKIAFHPNGAANKVLIDTNGCVGIGTDNPGGRLAIRTTANEKSLWMAPSAATTANVLHMECDSLTTGSAVYIHSNTTNNSGRKLVYINNDHSSATGTTCLYINQDSTGPAIKIDKTNVASGGDFNFIEMDYSGSWGSNLGGIAAISASDGNGRIGRYGIAYAAGGGRFVVTDLYDGGYGASGDVFYVRGDGDAYFQGSVGIATDNPTEKLTVLGNATVSGSITGSSKSFLIDHPTKENKKLEHGSLEGPEFGVYYRGRAQSDTITLPDYWTALVREETITVQLTPKGSFQHLYVVSQSLTEIVIGAADGETIDCFYTIYGERADIDSLVVEKEV